MPSRPSGAAKKQEPENEGGSRPGGNRPRSERASETARRHCQKALSADRPRMADRGKPRVNPGQSDGAYVADGAVGPQGPKNGLSPPAAWASSQLTVPGWRIVVNRALIQGSPMAPM